MKKKLNQNISSTCTQDLMEKAERDNPKIYSCIIVCVNIGLVTRDRHPYGCLHSILYICEPLFIFYLSGKFSIDYVNTGKVHQRKTLKFIFLSKLFLRVHSRVKFISKNSFTCHISFKNVHLRIKYLSKSSFMCQISF